MDFRLIEIGRCLASAPTRLRGLTRYVRHTLLMCMNPFIERYDSTINTVCREMRQLLRLKAD